MNTNNINGNVENSAKTEPHTAKETSSPVQAPKVAAEPKTVTPAPETKMLRIPLALFENKAHFEKFSKSVQAKATRAGVKIAGNRKWGPEIPVTHKEAGEIFKVAEAIYRSTDKSFGKNDKTFGYQLRDSVAKLFDIQIENVRKYVRKPKPEPVAVAAPVGEMQVAASMPPRANLDRASAILGSVISILQDNGQAGVAALIDQAKAEITMP